MPLRLLNVSFAFNASLRKNFYPARWSWLEPARVTILICPPMVRPYSASGMEAITRNSATASFEGSKFITLYCRRFIGMPSKRKSFDRLRAPFAVNAPSVSSRAFPYRLAVVERFPPCGNSGTINARF